MQNLTETMFADLFEAAAAICGKPKKVSNWIMTETIRLLEENEMDPDRSAFHRNILQSWWILRMPVPSPTRAAKVFEKVFKEDIDPEAYVKGF